MLLFFSVRTYYFGIFREQRHPRSHAVGTGNRPNQSQRSARAASRMDHKPSHRELTSVLISDLYGYVLSESDIVKAFENLLANLNDLILDIPDAPIVLGEY